MAQILMQQQEMREMRETEALKLMAPHEFEINKMLVMEALNVLPKIKNKVSDGTLIHNKLWKYYLKILKYNNFRFLI